MQPPSLSASSTDVANQLQRRAWQTLLAAATAARCASGAELDRGVPAHPEPRGGAHSPWLAWQGAAGWSVTAAAPQAVRSLLELYAPLCAVQPGRPLTLAHLGQSLDGHIATASGDSYYVTGPDNVRHLHRLRALCDAVIVGARTVEHDNPQLTVRHVEGTNPVRVVLDSRGLLAARYGVFTDGRADTLVVRAADARGTAVPGAAQVVEVPLHEGRLRLDALLEQLHSRGLWSVFVEGGGATVSSFIEAGLLDRLHVAIAPLITGSGRPALTLRARDRIAECLRPQHRVFSMGGDVLFDCDLRTHAGAPTAPLGNLDRVV
jgi:riboflavin-specific deaminase-like protein